MILDWLAILIDNGPPGQFGDVCLGHDRCQARGDDDPGNRFRLVHTGNEVIANPLNIVHVRVITDMGNVADAVTAFENGIERSVVIKISAVQRQSTRGIAWHVLKKSDLIFVIGVPDTGPDPIASSQQQLHNPAADKSCTAGHRNGASRGYWCHDSHPF